MGKKEIDNRWTEVWIYEFYIGILLSLWMIVLIIYWLISVILNYGRQYEWVCNKEVLTKINFLYTILTDDWEIVYNKNRIKTAGMDGLTCTVILKDNKVGKVSISDLNLIRNWVEKWKNNYFSFFSEK